MSESYFSHPQRFPKNVIGAFYTLGKFDPAANSSCGACLACEAPEHEAPDLLAEINDDNWDTYFVRQPESPEEVERACRAIEVCCASALRYGGQDRAIIERLQGHPEYCDYSIAANGALWRTVDEDGELLPAANRLANKLNKRRARAYRKANRRWWEFWIH